MYKPHTKSLYASSPGASLSKNALLTLALHRNNELKCRLHLNHSTNLSAIANTESREEVAMTTYWMKTTHHIFMICNVILRMMSTIFCECMCVFLNWIQMMMRSIEFYIFLCWQLIHHCQAIPVTMCTFLSLQVGVWECLWQRDENA